MKKKYMIPLIILGIFLTATLSLGTGYGVWMAKNSKEEKESLKNECFEIYLSEDTTINESNIKPILNDESNEKSPYSITIKNICSTEKEAQIRLNLKDTSTIDLKGFTISASGNIKKEITLYNDLKSMKTSDEHITVSKLIDKIKISPKETIRTNIRIWFDAKKATNILPEDTLVAEFEVLDTDNSIKDSFYEEILNNESDNIDENINYNEISSNYAKLLKVDNQYYFRGNVQTNYVVFASQTWRIISISENGSIKIVKDSNIATSPYNEFDDSPEYVGMHYSLDEEKNSKIYDLLQEWYQKNIVAKKLDKYVITNNYCNDTNSTGNWYQTYYEGYNRLAKDPAPNTSCNSEDVEYGGIIEQKIGLLTADEVVLAGGLYNINNYNYYLNNKTNYYTMTPAEYKNNAAYVMTVDIDGAIVETTVSTPMGVRPVLTLDPSTTISGIGTIDDPYIVDID